MRNKLWLIRERTVSASTLAGGIVLHRFRRRNQVIKTGRGALIMSGTSLSRLEVRSFSKAAWRRLRRGRTYLPDLPLRRLYDVDGASLERQPVKGGNICS